MPQNGIPYSHYLDRRPSTYIKLTYREPQSLVTFKHMSYINKKRSVKQTDSKILDRYTTDLTPRYVSNNKAAEMKTVVETSGCEQDVRRGRCSS